MINERLAAVCSLCIVAIVSFVAYAIEGDSHFLMVGSLFLTVELFLVGLGDRT